MSLDIDIDHFFEFLDGVQYEILSMVELSSLLDRFDHAYNIVKYSF